MTIFQGRKVFSCCSLDDIIGGSAPLARGEGGDDSGEKEGRHDFRKLFTETDPRAAEHSSRPPRGHLELIEGPEHFPRSSWEGFASDRIFRLGIGCGGPGGNEMRSLGEAVGRHLLRQPRLRKRSPARERRGCFSRNPWNLGAGSLPRP